MGNVMFCPQLHQDGIDCVSGAANGAGIIFLRHPPLLETYNLKERTAESEKESRQAVRFDLPPETKDLAYYGFDYRFTDETAIAKKEGERKVLSSEKDPSPNEFPFTTRLYHTKSATMITPDNHRKFGLHGKLFDSVSNCCQDIVQQELQDFYRYDVVTIRASSDSKPPIRAFVSPDLAETLSQDAHSEPQHASIQQQQQQAKPILLMMCGKGKSKAGVLSTKQLVLSGIESGSAVQYILQAHEQEMSVILLDPNAWGEKRGMEVINHSLTYFFGSCGPSEEGTTPQSPAGLFANRPIYVLAHSASGGYLTRYLSQGVARETLLHQIRRIAFTDSTHNLQWYKNDKRLWDFLQSRKCLYIRNNSAPRAFGSHCDKRAGEKHEGDHWWHHRFGNIPTVWAGTPEHSLMCWKARHVIWNFFVEE